MTYNKNVGEAVTVVWTRTKYGPIQVELGFRLKTYKQIKAWRKKDMLILDIMNIMQVRNIKDV